MAGFAYDTWGDSWGAAWGNSWGRRASNRNIIDGRATISERHKRRRRNEAIVMIHIETMIRRFCG